MVRYGFGLSEVRQLYIDEFHAFFTELAVILEKEGILKEGASDKIKGGDKGSDVDQLRSQLRKIGMGSKK
jgi:hypothetical protein